MFGKLVILILFSIIFSKNGLASNIQTIIPKEGQLSLFYNGVLILQSSPENPMLYVGRGSFQATDQQGNFFIEDNVFEVVELNYIEVTEFPENNEQKLNCSNKESGDFVVLRISENLNSGQLELRMEESESNLPYEMNRWFLNLPADVDETEEYIWGGGEQYSYFNLREGSIYPIWTREQGVGRNKSSLLTQLMDLAGGAGGDYHTTYWPQPSFLSSRKYHFESTFPTYHELRFKPKGDMKLKVHQIYWHYSLDSTFSCSQCKMVWTVEPTLMEIVQKINPGQPELPEWIYNGAMIGVQGGTERMLQILDDAQNAGVAVSGLWIQDWSGKITTEFGQRVFWNWKWNSTRYPNLDQVIQQLKSEQDIRVTAYMTAHLNVEGDIYQENENEDFWLKSDGHTLFQDFGEFNVTTVDIIEPDPECNCLNTARIWYKDLIKKNLIDLGLSGWMADFGEYTPMSASTQFSGRWWGDESSEILHNLNPQHWASLNREAVEESGHLGDVIYWMRAGGINSKYHQVMSWAGDQTVDWSFSDGLPSSIVAALSLAVSGMGLSHSDIGGYTSIPQVADLVPDPPIRDKELLLRWAEYSVFTPMMRTHEGNRPDVNAQIYDDLDTLTQFGRLTRIYKSLSPYIKEAVAQNTNEHIPVMRPLFLQYPDDPIAYDQAYEYMFGDDLLVAPVLEPGVDHWTAYLPGSNETWRWLWTTDIDVSFPGNQYIPVPAPIGMPAVFYKLTSPYAQLFRDIAREFILPGNFE